MSKTLLLITIVGMGLITFSQRLSFIILADKLSLPPLLRRGLKYVPTAVLTAIFVPDVLMPNGQLALTLNNPYLFAGLTAIIAAWFSKNVLVTMVIGMSMLWLWPYLSS